MVVHVLSNEDLGLYQCSMCGLIFKNAPAVAVAMAEKHEREAHEEVVMQN